MDVSLHVCEILKYILLIKDLNHSLKQSEVLYNNESNMQISNASGKVNTYIHIFFAYSMSNNYNHIKNNQLKIIIG